jgi:hypothetical protein
VLAFFVGVFVAAFVGFQRTLAIAGNLAGKGRAPCAVKP